MNRNALARRGYCTVPLLLVVAVLLLVNDDRCFLSSALSPTTKGRMRDHSASSPAQRNQRRHSRDLRSPFPSSISSSSTTNHHEHTPSVSASDDRRNQSLEQGHHPLWSLNLNLDSMAQAGAGNRAQELLKRIHALYREGYYEVSPDIVSYNSVLKAWKEEDEPEAALELLETMIRNEKEGEQRESMRNEGLSAEASNDSSDNTIRVDVISFNTVIAAFANQGNYKKALELLRKMQKEPSKRDNDGTDGDSDKDNDNDNYYYPNPDTITYNIVLYSLAQSNDSGTAARAENLLREMMMRKERTGLSVVDTMSFNTVLYAWSREAEKKNTDARPAKQSSAAGAGSDRVVRKRPVSPKMAAQRAEDLLTIMEELSQAGNLNVRPDVYSYTTVIQSWAKCGRAGGTDKARAILDQMVDKGLRPNQLTYTALMSALSKAGEPEEAESVLHQMIAAHHTPDTVAMSSIIDGWARVSSKDRPEAARRALQILRKMKQNDSAGMRPTATTYTSVLTALAKSGTRNACDKALELLREMEQAYAASTTETNNHNNSNHQNQNHHLDPKKQNKWSTRPKNIHYNCVLDAYARSSRADKAIKAQNVVTVMENHSRLDCRPDTISYNSLMMACAHATGNQELRRQSFEIALRTFKILVSKGGTANGIHRPETFLPGKPVHDLYPTSATFAHFFRACRKLLRPDNERRNTILTKSLTICRKLGLLNFLVVHQIQLACQSERVWREIAGELSDYVGWKDDFKRCGHRVPREWTCNARR